MFFCSQMFGFFLLGLCRRQPRNRQIHRQVCWKRHRISGVVGKERNIGFVGLLGNVEPKWCRKYRKWLCCEVSQLNPDLRRVWPFCGIFCLTFFREGCSPSRRAARGVFWFWCNWLEINRIYVKDMGGHESRQMSGSNEQEDIETQKISRNYRRICGSNEWSK